MKQKLFFLLKAIDFSQTAILLREMCFLHYCVLWC